MMQYFNILPNVDHFVCIVKLLGRARRLDEVEDLSNCMPVHPTLASYLALLGAYRYQGDVQRGERIAKHVLELNIMLSHVYALTGIMGDAYCLKNLWIYITGVKDCTHEFIIDD